MDSDLILVIVVCTALAFDFTNGFHDTANVVATSISTRAVPPRVAVGIALYREGAAPLIVMSGGGAGPISEAAVMRDLARNAGIPETVLMLEPESGNTFENAANTARLLHEAGKRRVVLVSDRVHLPRATRMFRQAGLDVVGVAGVPASSMRRAFTGVLYETASVMRGLFRRRRQS